MPMSEKIFERLNGASGVWFDGTLVERRQTPFQLLEVYDTPEDVRGTPVTRDWHVVSRKGKRLSPLAESFRTFLASDGAKLIEETTGVRVRAKTPPTA